MGGVDTVNANQTTVAIISSLTECYQQPPPRGQVTLFCGYPFFMFMGEAATLVLTSYPSAILLCFLSVLDVLSLFRVPKQCVYS
jgi:hypothetical protein